MDITRISYVAGPALMAGYGIVRLVSGHHGPGFGWTAGHLLMLGALVMFGWVIGGLRRAVPGAASGAFAVVSAVGLGAAIVQIVIDIVVGLISADAAAQSEHFARIQAVPGVLPVVYTVVPSLFQVGVLALAVVAAAGGSRPAPWWTPVLILAGSALAGLSLDYIPVAGLLYALALAPLATRTLEFAGKTA